MIITVCRYARVFMVHTREDNNPSSFPSFSTAQQEDASESEGVDDSGMQVRPRVAAGLEGVHKRGQHPELFPVVLNGTTRRRKRE
jgi:hypothetical protein